MEENATCSLCMEVFTDPVSLPCGHGFCRGCLRAVVGHNVEKKRREDTSSDSASLPCPLCRADVTLGPRGVDELQPNQALSDLMQRRTEIEVYYSAETGHLCDMCESVNRKAAHYCANCVTLYCEQCMASLHPPRGPLRRHRLMSIEQYLSEQTSHEADSETTLGEADCNAANCKEHGQPLRLYCGTCERPICNGCMSGHDDHVMQSVSTAFTRNKAPLDHQVNCCRTIKSELQKLQTELISTKKDIQTKAEEEYEVIEVNYKRVIKSLQAWRKSERDNVGDKRDKLTSETLSQLKKINHLIEETDSLITSSAELISGSETRFLQESKELLKRLKCNATEWNQELEEKRQEMTELRSALSRFDFRPCILTNLQVPQLKFSEASKPDAVVIQEEGLAVKDKPGEPAIGISVGTDGLLSQSQYWEVAVSWRVSSPPPPTPGSSRGWNVCSVGVRQKGSDFNSRLGCDSTSYGVDIGYLKDTNSYRFLYMHQGKAEAASKEQVLTDDSSTHRFGFLLQTLERTLYVIELGTETRLHTFRELDVSRPFVPVVWFGCGFFRREWRLLPVDGLTPVKLVLGIVGS